MGFDQRPPTSGGLDFDTDSDLPIADSSQAHDIPTGVGPSLAKLQDWIAWLRSNVVIYDDPVGSPGVILGDITIGGDLTVADDVIVASDLDVGLDLTVGDDLTVTDDLSVGGDSSLTGPVTAGSYVLFAGTPPASNVDPGANRAHATSLVRCSGTITTDGAGGSSVDEGLNIASVSVGSSAIRVTFARAFANNDYTIVATSGNGGDEFCVVSRGTSTTTFVDVLMRSVSTGAINPSTTACTFYVHATGRQ